MTCLKINLITFFILITGAMTIAYAKEEVTARAIVRNECKGAINAEIMRRNAIAGAPIRYGLLPITYVLPSYPKITWILEASSTSKPMSILSKELSSVIANCWSLKNRKEFLFDKDIEKTWKRINNFMVQEVLADEFDDFKFVFKEDRIIIYMKPKHL